MTTPELLLLGESAFLIRLGENLDLDLNRRARAFADRIRAANVSGVTDVVPANSSIGVYFDEPAAAQSARETLASILERPLPLASTQSFRQHEIPVIYNGPDLAEVAKECNITKDELVGIHSAAEYNVFAIGFAPGFAYMGELDKRISVPRLSQPRTKVPAGSVAIANRQTAIYPFDTPGGWRLIGSTTVRPFDIARDAPSLFKVGDSVRFIPQ